MIRCSVPPLSTQLTTAQAVQDELGIGHDPRMDPLVAQASAACVGYCGRPFAQATWIETFGAPVPLLLSRVPVTQVVSVTRNGIALADTDYELDADAGIILGPSGAGGDGDWPHHADGCFGWHRRSVPTVVTYVAGYLLPNDPGRTLPDDVERAALEMVKALWFSSGEGARDPGIRSETTEGIGATQYRDPIPGAFGLPSMARDLLTPYRRLV